MPLTWKEAVDEKKFLMLLAFWVIGLTIFILVLPYYFNSVIAPKPGMIIHDYLFDFLTPRDWSSEIFLIVFAAPALFFLLNWSKPGKILFSIQCYVVVNFARLISLYLFTLETPEGIIPLIDPFLERVAYGGNAVFTKDLFFSGHTSTLFIVFLLEDRLYVKAILLIATILVGLLLIWQRVHYSIDVLAALVITWMVVKAIRWANSKTYPNKLE